MKFAIRDDDTSYFTKPEELERAYRFVSNGTVSLSVVPFAVPHHEKGVLPYGEGIPFGYYPVGENEELVSFLRNNPRYDVMLHGYSHEYQKIDGEWYPEMLWKDESRLVRELRDGKAYLEELFQQKIRVFIAPNNAISAKGIRAVEANGLDYSGIIGHRDRDFSLRYAGNYVTRWTYRALTGQRIPDVLEYGRHREMVSCPLSDFDTLIGLYHRSKKRKAPFSVYTHYWELNRNPERRALLQRVYEYAVRDGAELVPLSALFD